MRDIASSPEQTEIALAYGHVRQVRRFYSSLMFYIVVISILIAVNYMTYRHGWWVVFPAAGWGVILMFRALTLFEWLPWGGPEWEKQMVEKRLGRKLGDG